MNNFLICLLTLGLYSLPHSNISMQKQIAQYYLQKKGEVYFKFQLGENDKLPPLLNHLSLDKMEDGYIYAFANQNEFTAFLQTEQPFETLDLPSEVAHDIKMSQSIEELRAWDTYPTYEAYLEIMNKFATDYPTLCSIEEIGQSERGRKLLVAKISDNVTETEKEPQILNTASIHGDETAGFVSMLHMIDSLLTGYATDPAIKELIDNTEIFISPLVNPDGAYKGGNSSIQGATRTNSNNIDLNRDFPDPVEGWLPYDRPFQAETDAFIKFEDKHSFVLSTDLHGGVEVVVYPWGTNWNKLTADDEWFTSVAGQYAQSARENSPSNYWTFEPSGIVSGIDWYKVTGGRMSYMLYFQSCRLLTLEISNDKILPASQLLSHWEYNKNAYFNFYREAHYGIQGTITDSVSNAPLSGVKVFVENHDKDSSHVFSKPIHGDYYRPIQAGTYTLTFSKEEYHSQTISGVTAADLTATTLDVKLVPLVIVGMDHQNNSQSFTHNVLPNGSVIFKGPFDSQPMMASLYNTSGEKIAQLQGKGSLQWNSKGLSPKGVYLVKMIQGNLNSTHRFVLN